MAARRASSAPPLPYPWRVSISVMPKAEPQTQGGDFLRPPLALFTHPPRASTENRDGLRPRVARRYELQCRGFSCASCLNRDARRQRPCIRRTPQGEGVCRFRPPPRDPAQRLWPGRDLSSGGVIPGLSSQQADRQRHGGREGCGTQSFLHATTMAQKEVRADRPVAGLTCGVVNVVAETAQRPPTDFGSANT